jgi:hypothetical protein
VRRVVVRRRGARHLLIVRAGDYGYRRTPDMHEGTA